MTARNYGQRSAMEDESMIGTLRAQAEMLWPLEGPLLEALLLETLGPGEAGTILDLGCGTGEVTGRVAARWPHATVVGVDLHEGHVRRARAAHPPDAWPRLAFRVGDAFALDVETASVDAVLVRHLLHALDDRSGLYEEVRRVLKPGGLLWALAEDYAGLLFDAPPEAASLFLDAREGMIPTGTELFHGRRAPRELEAAGFLAVGVQPIVVDTCNARRATWAAMLEHWRDGYAALIAQGLGRPVEETAARFDALIDAVSDPTRYSCWLLLGVSARR